MFLPEILNMNNNKAAAHGRFASRATLTSNLSADEVSLESSVPTAIARSAPSPACQTVSTNTRPVFVVGCPRSGTTLLYHMLLSSGAFAGYPFESDTFRILGAKFPNLTAWKNRKRLLEFWLRSENGAQSGLERSDVEQRVLEECQNIGDFLRIVMEAMCRKQGLPRWAEKTPDHALYIAQIKRFIPDALIVHIIRDGRDAALSLANFGRIAPYFWVQGSKLLSFGVYWKWIVQKGRVAGQSIRKDYCELHYEDLVEDPRGTLDGLSGFVGHDFDYDRIRRAGVGSVSQPDTSFREQASSEGFNPVNRWTRQCSLEELARFEALVGDCLEETGYSLATGPQWEHRVLPARVISFFYISQLELKHQLKSHTGLGRLAGWKRLSRS